MSRTAHHRVGTSAYVGMVCAAALAVMGGALAASAGSSHDFVAVLLFAAAFAVVQLLPVPIPHGRQLEMVRFEEAVVIPMVLSLQPLDALVAIGIGILAGHALTRAPGIKVAFNVSQMVLATSASLTVVVLLAGPAPGPTPRGMAAAMAGLVAMFVVNQLLVAGVMARAADVPGWQLLTDEIRLKALMWSANAALGLMLVLPLFHAPWLLGVSFVPLAFLHASYRAYVDRAQEEERLNNLQGLTRGMTRELSLEHTAQQLVSSARELVGAGQAELRLHDDERVFWARARHGVATAGATQDEDFQHDQQVDADITIPLSGRTGLSGILKVFRDPAGGAGAYAFSDRDRTLLEMLVRHAETALDNALLFARATSQRRKFAQIFEHSSEGLMVLADNGRVMSWNPAMASISRFKADDVVDSPIALLSPQLATIPDSRQPGSVDAVMTTAEGTRRQVRASYAPIRDDGSGSTSWVVVVRDITLERETERLKDDFVATVSHELRTPLTAIKGFLETMRRDDVDFEPQQVGMFLDIMSEQSDRLERLINDLLDMSLIESGRPLHVRVAPIEMRGEVQRIVQAFESARPEARIDVIDNNVPMMVETDRQRIHQIITNLLENACKHGGTLTPIEVTMRAHADAVHLTVRDHGPGISPSDARHIFDRFYCTSDSVTRTGGGAGLGLYICRKLLDAMGGKIEVQSTVGEGSAFTVTLPAVGINAASDDGAEPALAEPRRLRTVG